MDKKLVCSFLIVFLINKHVNIFEIISPASWLEKVYSSLIAEIRIFSARMDSLALIVGLLCFLDAYSIGWKESLLNDLREAVIN